MAAARRPEKFVTPGVLTPIALGALLDQFLSEQAPVRTTPRLLPFVLLILSACGRSASPVEDRVHGATETGPVVRVEASYPGANATVVGDTVAVPIEQQVNGVEGATSLESECRNDGSYTLIVRFNPGTDPNTATNNVLKRVGLAETVLPAAVRREGVTARSGDSWRFPTLWVAVTSPDASRDATFLNNYAERRLKDGLARLPGVANVRVVSRSESAVRVWTDPDRLAAHKLTLPDIVAVVGDQNAHLDAGQNGRVLSGKAIPLTFTYRGHLSDIEQLHRIILKATADGSVTRLGDVSRVEFAPKADGCTCVGGKPAAVLAVCVDEQKSAADVLRKALVEFEKTNPKGLVTALVADLSADRYAVVEVGLPVGTSATGVEKLIRSLPGAPECLTFAERDPNAATILVKLPAKIGPTPADLRKALNEIRGADVRVSALSAGRPFPVRIAILDKGGHGLEKLRAAGSVVAKRFVKDGIALDPGLTPGPPSPRVSVRIDRKKMAKVGASIEEVLTTLEASSGELRVLKENGGDALRVIGLEGQFRAGIDTVRQLEVKGSEGRRAPLGTFAEVRELPSRESTVVRVNLLPAVIVSADLPPGKTLTEATDECIRTAKAVVPHEFEVLNPSATNTR